MLLQKVFLFVLADVSPNFFTSIQNFLVLFLSLAIAISVTVFFFALPVDIKLVLALNVFFF